MEKTAKDGSVSLPAIIDCSYDGKDCNVIKNHDFTTTGTAMPTA
jgi:hypothetical protein